MKALKTIFVIILTLVTLFFIIGLILPNDAYLERSIIINAPPQKVFNQLNTFNTISAWSPWIKMDPDLKNEYFGPEFGVGALYTWDSDDPNVGQGKQEIIESRTDEYLKMEMTFVGMEDGEFFAEFILEPTGDDTKLTWTYNGQTNNFYWRYFMASTNFMLGPMYEEGLESLKMFIEGLPDIEIDPEIMVLDSTVVLE
jgi:uncharacterized protein YndB with AHSA1/START domain